jgi:hypothetical protein
MTPGTGSADVQLRATGTQTTVDTTLSSQRAADVTGTLRVTGPDGWPAPLPGER